MTLSRSLETPHPPDLVTPIITFRCRTQHASVTLHPTLQNCAHVLQLVHSAVASSTADASDVLSRDAQVVSSG